MTVQSANHTHLRTAVETAKHLGANWISFLAADLTSTAFNRETPWSADHQGEIGLTCEETKELEQEIDLLNSRPPRRDSLNLFAKMRASFVV